MKTLKFLAIAAIAIMMASCGDSRGADTPQDAVNIFTESFKTGDLEAFLNVLCVEGENGYKELNELEKAQVTELFNKEKDSWKGMETEILTEQFEVKGHVARGFFMCKKDDKQREETVYLLKNDGKWFVRVNL